jgi:hypothetical protein
MKRKGPKVIKMKRTAPKLVKTEVVKRPVHNGVYQPWMADDARDLCGKLGARIVDLAEYFGVCPATIDNWIRKKPDFERAVKKGRLECCMKIAGALFQRGMGYSHPDTHFSNQTIKEYDENGKLVSSRTELVQTPIIKHYPPDTPAAIKYLSILARDLGWSETTKVNMDVNHSGDINIHKVEELSMDDLSDEVKHLLFDLNLKQLSDAQLQ